MNSGAWSAQTIVACRELLLAAAIIAAAAPAIGAGQPSPFCGVDLAGSGRSALPLFTLKPHDEASQRPDFVTFRNRLKAILARRDTAALL